MTYTRFVVKNRLQEINAQPQSVMKGLFRDDPWTLKFKELLKHRGYVAIKSEQMQGLLLLLFAKREHLLHLRQVESEYTRTGLAGIWVNILNGLSMNTFNQHYKSVYVRVTKVLSAFALRCTDVLSVWSTLTWPLTITCWTNASKITRKSSKSISST